jgi:membrane protease subunit (stomatin/prohibitin family)
MVAWRHGNATIMHGSQLIVQEHQHAVLMKEGRMIGPFLPGRHTLDTKNLPVLKTLIGATIDAATPFPAQIWFVNRTINLNIRWGTSTPIQLRDPTYGIMLPVLGYGMLGVSVAESKKFLLKLVGSLQSYDQATVESHFRGILLSSIKTHIAKAIVERKISILDIAAHIRDLSDDLGQLFSAEFGDFGLSVVAFRIESITTREDDLAVRKLREALARKAEIQILGTDFAQQESFEVMKRAASNEGGAVAPFVGAGLGLGMGAAAGAQLGPMAANLSPQGPACPRCRTANSPSARFCSGCGQPVGATGASCPKCSAALAADAKFCGNCGTPQAIRCGKCGTALAPGVRFCGNCGTAAGGGS